MNPPGPISEVKEILNDCFNSDTVILKHKWNNFVLYISGKYNLKFSTWKRWCQWYLKKLKCEEILK